MLTESTEWFSCITDQIIFFKRGIVCSPLSMESMETFNLALCKVLILQKNTAGLRECQRMWVVWLCLICWYPCVWIVTACYLAIDLDKLIFSLIILKKKKVEVFFFLSFFQCCTYSHGNNSFLHTTENSLKAKGRGCLLWVFDLRRCFVKTVHGVQFSSSRKQIPQSVLG